MLHLPGGKDGQTAMWTSLSIYVRAQISSILPGFSDYLEENIGTLGDLATPRALRPEIRDGIYRDVVFSEGITAPAF